MKKLLLGLLLILWVSGFAHAQIFATVGTTAMFADRRVSIDVDGAALDVHDGLGLSSRKYSYGLSGLVVYPDMAVRCEWQPKTREVSTTTYIEDKKEIKNELAFISGNTLLEFAWITPYRYYRFIPIISSEYINTHISLVTTKDKKVNKVGGDADLFAILLGLYVDHGVDNITYYCKAEVGVLGNAKTNFVDIGARTAAFADPIIIGGGYRYKRSAYEINSLNFSVVEKGFYVEVSVLF